MILKIYFSTINNRYSPILYIVEMNEDIHNIKKWQYINELIHNSALIDLEKYKQIKNKDNELYIIIKSFNLLDDKYNHLNSYIVLFNGDIFFILAPIKLDSDYYQNVKYVLNKIIFINTTFSDKLISSNQLLTDQIRKKKK